MPQRIRRRFKIAAEGQERLWSSSGNIDFADFEWAAIKPFLSNTLAALGQESRRDPIAKRRPTEEELEQLPVIVLIKPQVIRCISNN